MSDIRTQTKKDDLITVKGKVTYKLLSANGQLKERRDIDNLIVTVGKNFLAAWLAASSQSTAFMQYIGLGTGTNAPTSGDTTLQTEFSGGGYSRGVGTLSSSSNVFQNQAVFGPGNGTGAITEAGLFSATTSGTMFSRQTFSVINKMSGDTLTVTWQITFS